MHLFGERVFDRQIRMARNGQGQAGTRLRAAATAMLTLAACMPAGWAQQAPTQSTNQAAS